MAVAVQRLGLPVRETDPLDQVSKALSIASQVYGIKSAMDQADLLKESKAMTKAEKERELSGILTPKELLGHQKDFEISESPIQGAMKYKIQDNSGVRDIYLKPKKKEEDPLIRAIREQQYQQNIDKKDPTKFQNLQKEKQIQIEKLSQNLGQSKTVNSLMIPLLSQLDDPKISDEQKAISANEQLKLLNSTLGPDALGAGETERVSGWLSNKPNPFIGKWSLGPDIGKFREQLQNAVNRNTATQKNLENLISEQYGKNDFRDVDVETLMQEKIRRQGIRSTIPQRKK